MIKVTQKSDLAYAGGRVLFLLLVLMSCSAALFAADVTLAWNANTETDLAGYRVYYGTSSRNYGASIDVSNVTTYTLSNLASGTYYFAVTAYNTSNLESAFSNEVSTTISSPSDTTPPVILGVLASSITSSGATITWTTNEAADSQVDFGLSSSFGSTTALDAALVSSHSQSLSGLNPGTLYYFRVKSSDAAANLSVSNTYNFTTAALPCSYSVSPAQLSPGASTGTATVSVTAAAGCAWTAASNTAWITINAGAAGTGNGTVSCAVTANSTGTPRTGTLTVAGQSVTVNQMGSAPAAPANLSPANGATGISLTPTLSWSASSAATSYDVYFGTNSSPSLVTNTAGTSYAPGTLAAGTTYYWRVAAVNSSGSTASATISFITMGTAPPAPTNLSPADGSTGVSLTPTLSWSPFSGATSYDVYFGTSNSPSLAGNTTGTVYTPGTLSSGTLYYWRVVAKNSAGSNSTPTISFTTGGAPPAPANLSPANGSTGVSRTPTLSWSASSGASSYEVYFGTASTPPLSANTTGTSYSYSTLASNTVYYWRVVAKNGFGTTSSATISFTTLGNAPPAPANLSPADGSTGVSRTPTLSWSPSPGATSYDVYFGASSTPSLATSTAGTSYAPAALNSGTLYFWRVVAKNSLGSSSSDTVRFTTAGSAPPAPTNLSPANDSTGVPLTVRLTWAASSGATSYDVYFGTETTPPLAGNTTATSYAPGTLTSGTTYYWRVVAKNSSGSASSLTVGFATAGTAPPAPTNLNPSDHSTGIAVTSTLFWTASPGATSYDVYFGTVSAPSLAANTTTAAYTPAKITAGATYYWRVVAKNSYGSTSSATISFTTAGNGPAAPSNLSPANGSTNVSLNTALFWSASTGASSYDVYFGTSAAPAFVSNATGTAFSPGTLDQGTTYYWRVVAKNSFGSNSSATISFTTTGTKPPAAPDNLSPANGSEIVSLHPALSWSAVAGATKYDIYFGTTDSQILLGSTDATSYSPGTLEENVGYGWRVVARNSAGSASSNVSSFIVVRRFKAVLPRLVLTLSRAMEANAGEYTGIAIANLGSTDAALELTAYTSDGAVIAGPDVTNPAQMTLKPGQQLPILDVQVFGSGLADAGAVAWMEVASTSEKINSYFMEFDNALTNLDGAVISNLALTSFVLPRIRPQGTTQISVANPSSVPANLTIMLVDADGNTLRTETRQVGANGSLTETVASIFPDAQQATSQYLSVMSDTGVMPIEFLRNPSGDTESIGGLDTAGGSVRLYAPQYAVGGPWRSSVSLINLDPVAGSVTLRFLGNDGSQIGVTRTENIPANGKVQIEAPDYFGNFDGIQTGYLEIVSSGPRITGSLAFGGVEESSFAASLPLVSEVSNSMVFSHVASNSEFYTGLAILNANAESTDVIIDVYAADGTWELTTQETIPAGGRLCKLLTEFFPAMARISQTSGYMKVKSAKGVLAFALFGTQNLSSLAALPAQNTP